MSPTLVSYVEDTTVATHFHKVMDDELNMIVSTC